MYDQIKEWLIEQETHQILIDMLMAVIWRNKIEIPQEYTIYWSATKNKLKKLTYLQVMQGFLPQGMWQQQHEYYLYLGSRKQGYSWGTKLCEKLIDASHSLWNKRNTFEHDRKLHGLIEVEDIRLKKAIKEQFSLGKTNLKQSDEYLFQGSMLDLWSKNGTYIRLWLATVLIARGEYQEAKMELTRSRGNMGYKRIRPTGSEIRKCKKRRKNLKKNNFKKYIYTILINGYDSK